jgi:hypothetical protein
MRRPTVRVAGAKQQKTNMQHHNANLKSSAVFAAAANPRYNMQHNSRMHGGAVRARVSRDAPFIGSKAGSAANVKATEDG